MSKGKYLSTHTYIFSYFLHICIFSPQMEATVFIILQIFLAMRAIFKIGEYINTGRRLARQYAQIFVRGHYRFREATSVQRAKLEEKCELRAGQLSRNNPRPSRYLSSDCFRRGET